MNNYGFQAPVQDERAYQLGKVSKPINESGQWTNFAPKGETQGKAIDPNACTGFALCNVLEFLERYQFATLKNYSDRYISIASGTYPPGNNPVKVMDTARKEAGMIPEEVLPFGDNIKTLDEYYTALKPQHEKLGRKWLSKWGFYYEEVFTPWRKTNKPKAMMKALKVSPLSVSGDAWQKDGEYYVKPKGGRDNHNFVIMGYKENEYWIIYDSYPDGTSFIKKLAWDYDFGFAWSIVLYRKEDKPNWLSTFCSLIKSMKCGIIKSN